MDHLSSLIPGVLRKRGLYAEAQASLIVYRAKKWLEENHSDIAPALHPHVLKGGVLTVHADHSIAEKEGALCGPDLLLFLQSSDKNAVTGIRVCRK